MVGDIYGDGEPAGDIATFVFDGPDAEQGGKFRTVTPYGHALAFPTAVLARFLLNLIVQTRRSAGRGELAHGLAHNFVGRISEGSQKSPIHEGNFALEVRHGDQVGAVIDSLKHQFGKLIALFGLYLALFR